jgi:DNA repair exonuclease SbcCD ATPase subunit
VKLKRLVIQNFLSVQNATLNLADKGLVSIDGSNEDKTGSDSNGCGKSSIINAILWCLYGNYGKDEAADDVVNSQAGKNCMVETYWREEGSKFASPCEYKITRYRKHSKHKNAVRVKMQIPGLKIETPEGTIAPEWTDITKAGAQAVQDQINQIMGASENVFRASCFAQQEDAIDIPGMTDKELKTLLESVLPLEDLTPLHQKAHKAVADHMDLIEGLKYSANKTSWQIDRFRSELKETLDLRLKYTKELDARTVGIANTIKAKRVAYGVALAMANKGTLVKDIAALVEERKAITDTDVGMASYRHMEALKAVKKLEDQIAAPNNNCSKCGQEVEDLSDYLARLNAELGIANAKVAELRDKAKVTSYNATIASDLDFRIESLRSKLAEANRSADAADRLKAEIRLLEGQKAPSGENPHTPTVTRLRGQLKAAIADKENYDAKLKEAYERLETLKAVELTYSPKGLRYHVLEKVAPRLTHDTNKYLNILTDGAISAVWSTVSKTSTGEFREKFSIEARMEGRSKFGLLSGGEKRKVRLACFFALQDLIASQATKHIDLWCGDEIDNALDGAGMERLMGLLNEKTKTKSTILVISHNELQEWIPNHATVTRKDGVSTIAGYLNAT